MLLAACQLGGESGMTMQGTCIMDSSSTLNIFQTCVVSYKFGAECDIARRPLQAPSNHSIHHLTFTAEQRNPPQGILPLKSSFSGKYVLPDSKQVSFPFLGHFPMIVGGTIKGRKATLRLSIQSKLSSLPTLVWPRKLQCHCPSSHQNMQ